MVSRADSSEKGKVGCREGDQVAHLGVFGNGEIPFVNRDDVVGIGLGVVAAKFGEFGHVTPAVAAL